MCMEVSGSIGRQLANILTGLISNNMNWRKKDLHEPIEK